jgi:hypothetical protein
MKIFEIYYTGLCVLDCVLPLYDRETWVDYAESYDGAILQTESAIMNNVVYHKLPYNTIQEVYDASDVQFVDTLFSKLKKGDVGVFILAWWQIRGFEARMKRCNLDKYIIHRSAMAGNINYPQREPYLSMQTVILHYKD